MTSYEERLSKPDEAFYGILLKKVGCAAEECIFVDDRQENVEAAQKMGFKAVLYEDCDSLVKSFKELGIDI